MEIGAMLSSQSILLMPKQTAFDVKRQHNDLSFISFMKEAMPASLENDLEVGKDFIFKNL